MLIKQVSVYMEHKEGRITEVLKILGDNNIDVLALSIADSATFEAFRLILSDPQKAKDVLLNHEMLVRMNDVIAVDVDDTPGSLGKITNILFENKVVIEYLYAFTRNNTNKAKIVFKMSDTQKAIDCLSKNNITLITKEDIMQKWD